MLISRLDMLSAMVRRCKDVGAPCRSTVSIVTKRPPVPGCASGDKDSMASSNCLLDGLPPPRVRRAAARLRGSDDVYPRCAASVAPHAARVARGGRTMEPAAHWWASL